MPSIYPDKIQQQETFFENLKELKLRAIPLRKLDDNFLLNVPIERHQEFSNLLHENKVKVLFLEFDISYSLTAPISLDELFNLSIIYQTKKLLIPLPQITSFANEKDDVLQLIDEILVQGRKKRTEIVFKVNCNIESSSLAYLIKKRKNITFSFSPAECFVNNRSITSYYRLLKNNLSIVTLNDLNEGNIPVLLGYGKTQILDTLDKLSRDRFKGDLIYDYNLKEYTKTREKAYNRFFKNPFGRKKRKAHLEMDRALKLSSEDSLSIIELINSQLLFIRKYQKL